jgi:hypothetical protein
MGRKVGHSLPSLKIKISAEYLHSWTTKVKVRMTVERREMTLRTMAGCVGKKGVECGGQRH